jgi:Transposase IS66 family
VRAGATLHADDTPVPVLDPGRGRTKTGRLWTAVRDERPYGSTAPPAAFYLYSPDRKAERAHTLLKGCRGHLHADAYAGFAGLYEANRRTGAPAPLTEVACWAHARRKIYDVHVETKSPAAAQALEMIARLFAIEADIKGSLPPSASLRVVQRQRRSSPNCAPSSTRRWRKSAARAALPAPSVTLCRAGRRWRATSTTAALKCPTMPPSARSGHWPSEERISVRRLGRRRPPCGDPVHADRNSPPQRRRSRGLARRRYRPHSRSPDQSRR